MRRQPTRDSNQNSNNSAIADIANSGTTSPLGLQLLSGTNDTSRSDESIESSGIVMPADQLGATQPLPDLTGTPIQSTFNQQLQSIKEQGLKIQDALNSQPSEDELLAGIERDNQINASLGANTPQVVGEEQTGIKGQLQQILTDMFNTDTSGDSQGIRDYYGLQEKEKLSRDLNNEATAIKRDYEARIREARTNPTGKFQGALQMEIDDITYEGNLLLSEKMFQYSIANGDFQQAEKLANQVISDLEKADARKLDLLKTAWDFVQDDLTESEKLQITQNFDAQQLERRSELDLLKSQFEYELDGEQRSFDNNLALQSLSLQRQSLALSEGKIASDNAKDAEKAKARRDQQASTGELVINTVDEALGLVNNSGATGFIGGSTKLIPNTPAYNLDQTVLTIKANLGFDRLQQMRENSPTGGALGQVAVQELENLQATVGSLAVGQDSVQLQNNLLKVREHYENWLEASGYTIAPNGDVIFIDDNPQ